MTEPNGETRWLMPWEAAEMLDVSPKTLSRWAKEGRLPHKVVSPWSGHRRYDLNTIREFALQQQAGGRVETDQ